MDGLWISLGKGTGNEDGKGKARKSDGVDKFGGKGLAGIGPRVTESRKEPEDDG